MTKTYFKWYLFAAAALFIILLSAQPWKWLAANADEQGYIDLVIEKHGKMLMMRTAFGRPAYTCRYCRTTPCGVKWN